MATDGLFWRVPAGTLAAVAVIAAAVLVIAGSLAFAAAACAASAGGDACDRAFDRLWEWVMEEPVT